MTFIFKNSKKLQKIIEHCKTRGRTFTRPYTDTKEMEPMLHLVKDQGVYLMAGCREILAVKKSGKKNCNHSLVVYALGYGKDTFMGGDDFVESIPVRIVEAYFSAGNNAVLIAVGPNVIRILGINIKQ